MIRFTGQFVTFGSGDIRCKFEGIPDGNRRHVGVVTADFIDGPASSDLAHDVGYGDPCPPQARHPGHDVRIGGDFEMCSHGRRMEKFSRKIELGG